MKRREGKPRQRRFFFSTTIMMLLLYTLLINLALNIPYATATSSLNHDVGNLEINMLSDFGRILQPIYWGGHQTIQDDSTLGFIGLVIDHDNYDHTPGSEDIADCYNATQGPPYMNANDFVPLNAITMIIDNATTQKSFASFQNKGTGTGYPEDIVINQTCWTVVNKDWAILQLTISNIKSPSAPLTNVRIGLEVPISKEGGRYGLGGNLVDSGDDIDGYDATNDIYWAQDTGDGTTIGFGSAIVSDPITHYYAEDYYADYSSEYVDFFGNDTWLYQRLQASNNTATDGITPGNITTTVGWDGFDILAGEYRTVALVIAINDTFNNMITAIKDAQNYYNYVATGFRITEFSDQQIEIYNFGRATTDLSGPEYSLTVNGGTLTGTWTNNPVQTNEYAVFTRTGGASIDPEGDTIRIFKNGDILDEVSFGQMGMAPDPLNGESTARRYDSDDAIYTDEWLRNASSGPTWGAKNDVPSINFNPSLVLNEIMFYPNVASDGFVELFLKYGTLNISGYKIIGDIEYIIPVGTILTPKDQFFYLMNNDDPGFFSALNPSGDNIYLYDDNGKLLDMAGWSSLHVQGETMSRVPDGEGTGNGFGDLSSVAAGWVFGCTPTVKLVKVNSSRNVRFDELGKVLIFNLTIFNKQSVNDTFLIFNATLNGYPVAILDGAMTLIISEVFISAGSFVNIKVMVNLPSTMPFIERDNITITIQSQNQTRIIDTIILYAVVQESYYWIIGQLPEQSHVYLYAREGANVTFSGTIDIPVIISVPPDQFVWYNIGDLGYIQNGTEWYFLEMCSNKPLMVNFDRAVYLKTGSSTYEWKHGDQLHNMPMTKLSTLYYVPYGQSGSGDDLVVMYAHEPTQVTVRAISNSGVIRTKTVTVDGLYNTGYLNNWFTNFDLGGYSLKITSNKPIAAAGFDELGWWPDVCFSGYFYSGALYTELYNEYMHIHSDPGSEAHIFYTPTANTFEYYDLFGNLVNTDTYPGEASRIFYLFNLGYSGSPDPFLVHVNTSEPYTDKDMSPSAWYVSNVSAYMGWNSSFGTLEIYTDQDTHIWIYNGRDYTIKSELDMVANTIFRNTLANIGFVVDQPFLVVIISEVPVYNAVKVPYYVRPYPAELAPPVVPPPLPPNLYINVSQDGKDAVLYWDPPLTPGIDHYLIYRSTSQTDFDFNTVWKNTSSDKEVGEPSPIPLRRIWNDTNAAFIENFTNYKEQYYYTIRAVNILGEKSSTSRTVGKWTKTLPKGVSTFSLPLQPLQNMTIDRYLEDMNAKYIKWMHPGLHKWMKHGDGGVNDTQMIVGEGYEVKFSNQTNFTFTGMPGAMISYDDDSGFSGFDHATEAKNLTVTVEPNGDVNLTWQEPSNMNDGWYEVYFSNKRDGFFGTFNMSYFSVCPAVNFGNNIATHVNAFANQPNVRLYYMVVPYNSSGIRGSGTYSIGVWTEEYLAQYDTMGIPLKLSNYQTADWYCNKIPDTVGINYYIYSEQRWCWHSLKMPAGAYDPELKMTEGYQISTSSATKFTFIGV